MLARLAAAEARAVVPAATHLGRGAAWKQLESCQMSKVRFDEKMLGLAEKLLRRWGRRRQHHLSHRTSAGSPFWLSVAAEPLRSDRLV